LTASANGDELKKKNEQREDGGCESTYRVRCSGERNKGSGGGEDGF